MDYRIRWTISNGLILALFLIGINYDISGVLQLSIIMYWTISILALLLFSNKVCDEMIEATKNKSRTTLWLNVTYDSGIVVMLAYFNYPILAFVYTMHIFAQCNFYERLNKPVDKDSNNE